jgi:6,7-dimethyl-8-ribityllumazine synthase
MTDSKQSEIAKGISMTDVNLPDLGAVRQLTGGTNEPAGRVAIVVGRFNQVLTQAMLESAIECLREKGLQEDRILVVWVPGAYEIPGVVKQLARREDWAAILTLGVVIDGETHHAELINETVVSKLADLSVRYGVPVIYEVVAARTVEQARQRCLGGRDSLGWYAAEAACEMAGLYEQLKGLPHG